MCPPLLRLAAEWVADECWNGPFRGSTSDLHSIHLVILGALAASILFAELIVAHTVQQLWKVAAGVVFPVVTIHKDLSQLC